MKKLFMAELLSNGWKVNIGQQMKGEVYYQNKGYDH